MTTQETKRLKQNQRDDEMGKKKDFIEKNKKDCQDLYDKYVGRFTTNFDFQIGDHCVHMKFPGGSCPVSFLEEACVSDVLQYIRAMRDFDVISTPRARRDDF